MPWKIGQCHLTTNPWLNAAQQCAPTWHHQTAGQEALVWFCLAVNWQLERSQTLKLNQAFQGTYGQIVLNAKI